MKNPIADPYILGISLVHLLVQQWQSFLELGRVEKPTLCGAAHLWVPSLFLYWYRSLLQIYRVMENSVRLLLAGTAQEVCAVHFQTVVYVRATEMESRQLLSGWSGGAKWENLAVIIPAFL